MRKIETKPDLSSPMWCLQTMYLMSLKRVTGRLQKRRCSTFFFFFTQINLLWASQRDHMERGNVTKISMNISKSSNLSNLHVWDVCCLYRLSEHFVNYKVFIVRWDSIPPQRHAVTNITGTAAQGIVLFKRSYTLFLASV